MALDVYKVVTDHILSSLENLPDDKLVMPWHRTGLSGLPNNIDTGNTYNGVNIVSLWVTAVDRGYSSNTWGTYKQWAKQGAQVRKGEKSTLVIFYKEYLKEDDDGEKTKFRMARASYAFNAAQVDGYDVPMPEGIGDPMARLEAVDAYVAKTGAKVVDGSDIACYSRSTDTISMPDGRLFFDTATSSKTENYYAVLLHELVHWTMIEPRCNRDMAKRFGDEVYAMEELVAELGAAFQCAQLGISSEPREDHAKYIASWLKALKNDPKAIFTAAARAQEAVQFIRSF